VDVDAGLVLCETRYLACAIHWHCELLDPVGERAFDVVLPQSQHVVVPTRNVGDVQRDVEVHGGMSLSLRQESLGDPALIEHFDGAYVQTACARADEFLAGAPLNNRRVDSCERQLGGQHQTCWTTSDDHHCMGCLLEHSCLISAGSDIDPAIL